MNRMKFYEFSYKLTAKAKIKLPLVSAVAPIIYQYEDAYYNACVKFLEAGEKDNLTYDKYSVFMIMENMEASYVEALMILHNIQDRPELAYMIYTPKVVE